ncbi:Choline-sulfatase [Stieleria maiorica]|uniref:Choline-sulfatase n=1 Tax=Stieleria maiorica TaxID=2795974 RepID=A0A5B9MQ76_9BACT|nr:sulfatase [Stieleria maiorica]QEG02550.1 Choline-sulfatase [Stieleria maiorica]
MRRHRFVAVCLIALVVGAIPNLATAQEKPSRQSTAPPNVLFIAIDDLNDWVGCLGGHPNALTPNIDRLAARGVLFSNAHCQAPICGPSRASLFTGLLPSTSGIYAQIKDKLIPQASEITGKVTLMPDYFERHGYTTLACGKLFHNGDAAKVFDDYGGHSSFGPKPKQRFKYDPAWFPEKIGGTQTDWGVFPESDDLMPDYHIAAYGVDQLSKSHDQPFFLAVGFMRPHVPWYCPQEWFDKHPVDQIQLPPYLKNDLEDVPELSRRVNELPAMPTTEWAIKENEWKNIVQAYLACTTFVDAQVGKVLDALDGSRYADNTIVVLWSDHGYHVGEKNRFAKQALWDRANRVPLIVAAAGREGGKVCKKPVGLIDLYPTLLDLCGLPANPMNEGRSIVPLVDDPNQSWPAPTLTTYGKGNHAIQTERYRFYRYEDGSMELYDHQVDANEWKNLASDPAMKDVIDQLSAALPKHDASPTKYNSYPTNEYFLAK